MLATVVGELVDVTRYFDPSTDEYYYEEIDGKKRRFKPHEISLISNLNVNWEQRRYEIAKGLLLGFPSLSASECVVMANDLINRLSK